MTGRLFFHLLEDMIRNISGPLGVRLRRFYYKRRLGKAGYGLIIDTGVYFHSPKSIYLGDQVWIDKNVICIAGHVNTDSSNVSYTNQGSDIVKGEIRIGSYSHIGIGTIIQGHGGFSAGSYFTSSAGCRIYSYSNDPQKCKQGTLPPDPKSVYYVMGPVEIGNNVWIGLGASVISTSMGDDVFVLPHAVVYHSLEKNTVAGGNPAVRIRSRFPE